MTLIIKNLTQLNCNKLHLSNFYIPYLVYHVIEKGFFGILTPIRSYRNDKPVSWEINIWFWYHWITIWIRFHQCKIHFLNYTFITEILLIFNHVVPIKNWPNAHVKQRPGRFYALNLRWLNWNGFLGGFKYSIMTCPSSTASWRQ